MFYVLSFVPYILVLSFIILGLRYHTHMLQLSSYQFQGYFRHLRTDAVRAIAHLAFIVCVILTFSWDIFNRGTALIAMFGAIIIFIALWASYLPKKAKTETMSPKIISSIVTLLKKTTSYPKGRTHRGTTLFFSLQFYIVNYT